jgi:hypothetical protein
MWTTELMRKTGKDRANSFGLRVRVDGGGPAFAERLATNLPAAAA